MKKGISWLLVGSVITVYGCGTIISGTTQIVQVNSEPSGARVTVDGFSAKTPATVTLARIQDHIVTLQKEGCEQAQVQVMREFQGVRTILGNILFLLIGAVVDLVTGGAYDLTPENVNVTLDCKPKSS